MEKIFTVWLKNNENVRFSIEAKSQREAKQKVASYNLQLSSNIHVEGEVT